MKKSIVYFTKEVSPEALIKLYQKLGKELPGKVACKLHSGEEGNQNYVRPEFVKPIIDYVKGTVVECNTAYLGSRNTIEKHLKTIENHGWNKYFTVDLMDRDGDFTIDIPSGKVLDKDYVGKDLSQYDSMLVLSHFKGHPMGGYGGALKQLSIGVASARGKCYIHTGGKYLKNLVNWEKDICPQLTFLESMADAASAVHNYFKGNIIYINMMVNMSVDCDCCDVAEDPCMKDMGCLISLDPIAIDQACLDIVTKSNDPGVSHFMERVNSRQGTHTIEAANELGFGTKDYELICID